MMRSLHVLSRLLIIFTRTVFRRFFGSYGLFSQVCKLHLCVIKSVLIDTNIAYYGGKFVVIIY